ncbi:MAG TPA: regulatory protein GemA [Candidatus Binataceae bacterium]|nr:regulatory protein GemA [Candidatus Binataceae bacterium]
MRTDDPRRRADLAAIHVAKKQLRLDDDLYREIIRTVTEGRIESAADATPRERGAIIEHLRSKGFRKQESNVRPLRQAQGRMARGLWIEGAKLGIVRDKSDDAFRKFVKSVAGVDRPEWMTPAQANKVIEALKAMHRRKSGEEVRGDGFDG